MTVEISLFIEKYLVRSTHFTIFLTHFMNFCGSYFMLCIFVAHFIFWCTLYPLRILWTYLINFHGPRYEFYGGLLYEFFVLTCTVFVVLFMRFLCVVYKY